MPRLPKSPATNATPVAAPAAGPPTWQRALRKPRFLILLAAPLAIAAAVTSFRHISPILVSRPEYRIHPAEVILPPAPAWIPRNLAEQVFNSSGLGTHLSLLDPTVSERVAAAFHSHPWIERVVSVQKRWPSRIVVDAVYRQPVAMVRGIDGFYPIDHSGILLPARDFSDTDVQQFPVIEQVTSNPLGRLGEPWGDPAVAAAAKLAEVLLQKADEQRNWWQLLNLAAIVVPRNVTLPDSAEELQFELRTKGGSRILWGRSPEARHPGEIDLTRKLQRLRELHSRFGNPDNQQDQWQIDIRSWQGVRRDILSSAPAKDSIKN